MYNSAREHRDRQTRPRRRLSQAQIGRAHECHRAGWFCVHFPPFFPIVQHRPTSFKRLTRSHPIHARTHARFPYLFLEHACRVNLYVTHRHRAVVCTQYHCALRTDRHQNYVIFSCTRVTDEWWCVYSVTARAG